MLLKLRDFSDKGHVGLANERQIGLKLLNPFDSGTGQCPQSSNLSVIPICSGDEPDNQRPDAEQHRGGPLLRE